MVWAMKKSKLLLEHIKRSIVFRAKRGGTSFLNCPLLVLSLVYLMKETPAESFQALDVGSARRGARKGLRAP